MSMNQQNKDIAIGFFFIGAGLTLIVLGLFGLIFGNPN